MSERLCGGRIVSVHERHCLAALADGEKATDARPSGGEGARGAPGGEETPVVEGDVGVETDNELSALTKGKGKGKARGDVETRTQGVSEIECLQGHMRGLRSCGA